MGLIPHRDRFFTGWAALSTGHPRLVLLLSLLLAIAGIFFTITDLNFKSDRSDLIDPDLAWQQRYAEFKERFPRWDDAIIVVDTAAAQDSRNAFWNALQRRVEESDLFGPGALLAGVNRAAVPASLTLLEPENRLREILRELDRVRPALNVSTLADLLDLLATTGSRLRGSERTEAIALLERVQDCLLGEGGGWILAEQSKRVPFTTPSGRYELGFVSLAESAANGDGASVNAVAPAITALRAAVEQARRSAMSITGGSIDVGVTGIPVLESDETEQSMRDGMIASVVSLIAIGLLMIIVYRGIATPLLALAALLLGIAWSFGWVTLAVGHLQVLSVVFAIVLLGLGVDNAIHLIARLELVHPDHDHMPQAVGKAMRGVGAGVVTGALTTASAFAAMGFTRFSGVAEMGVIAAGGVLLCCVSVLTALPALLELVPHPERILRARAGGVARPYAGRLGLLLDRRPRVLLALSMLVVCVAGWLASGVRYDPDLTALMPPDAESVAWERRLAEDDDRSAWHAVVLVEPGDPARELADTLRESPRVGSIGGGGVFYPGEEERETRLEVVRSIVPAPAVESRIDPSGRLRLSLDRAASAFDVEGLGEEWSDGECTDCQTLFEEEQRALRDQIETLRTATWPTVADLPAPLRALSTTTDGALVFRVYQAETGQPGSVLSRERLNPFVRAVLRIAPDASGPAVQIYESTRLILRSYKQAVVYALVAIFLVLLWDFRRLNDTLCALVPVVCGGILTLGAMRLFSIPLNFANTIVLPLLMGIGVDAGVHAVHRWRLQPMDAPAGLAGGTGRAVSLTVLTTIFGFASLMLAEHRGVRSLGQVMTLGLALVWVSTVFLLPPILRLRSPHRKGG